MYDVRCTFYEAAAAVGNGLQKVSGFSALVPNDGVWETGMSGKILDNSLFSGKGIVQAVKKINVISVVSEARF